MSTRSRMQRKVVILLAGPAPGMFGSGSAWVFLDLEASGLRPMVQKIEVRPDQVGDATLSYILYDADALTELAVESS